VFNLGAGEITVILVLALLFIGPKQLPDLAAKLGKVIRDIRKATSDIKNEITLDDSFRKPFEELHDAVTLHPDELKRRDSIKKAVEEAKKRAEAEAARIEAEAAAALPAVEPPAPTAALPLPTPETSKTAPVGTVAAAARTIHGVPPAPEAEENAPMSMPPGEDSAASPFTRPRRATPSAAILTSAVTPLGGAPRVTPPVSSLEGDRANTTQALSEADLLASAPPAPPRKPTPPPLPGLDRNPPPANRMGLPRVTPPVSSLSGDRANATQSLSESDLLPPGASKPPPLPGSKKA
jgi:sec-independent protein translocase protein TatB